MACSMVSVAVQETQQGSHPTTSSLRPRFARLHIVAQSRQVFDFEKVGQSRNRPNANRFYQEHGFGTSVIVQFIIGIGDLETGELWNCIIRNKQRRLVLDNGLFIIDVKINPNGLVCFPMTDIKQEKLPDYLGNVKCILPVEADEPLAYCVKISLYKKGDKKRLDCLKYRVRTHVRDHDIYDFKEGRTIMEVERPQLKIKMTGLLAEEAARRILMFFQNLVDNGFYKQFNIEQQKLLQGLKILENQFGEGIYKDLKLSVKLEESIMLFRRNRMDDSLRIAEEVLKKASNSPNGAFLMSKAHTIKSPVYRQRGDLERARKHMVLSTELLEQVVVCEETAVNRYNWAALLSEKAVMSSLTSSEKKDAEFCFENCLLHWKEQKQNTTNREPMRSKTREINFHLTTKREEFPDESKPITEERLAKAWQAIEHIEGNLLNTCSIRLGVTFHIAKCDYYIRKLQMKGPLNTPEYKRAIAEIAMNILENVLKEAKELYLNNEVRAINVRMRNLSEMFWPDRVWLDESASELNQPEKNPQENDENPMAKFLSELVKTTKELQDKGELHPG